MLSLSFPLRAQQVLITGVEGQVFYGAGAHPPAQAVKSGQKLGPGTFSASNDGILYLSAFDGSELRLSEAGTLTYDGDDELCELEGGGHNLRSNFHLRQGKAQLTVRLPARPLHCYRIVVRRSAASMSEGQCVLCMHGARTFLFVARGRVAVVQVPSPGPEQSPVPEPGRSPEPFYGALPEVHKNTAPRESASLQWLVGDGRVGLIGNDGTFRMVPLSALQAGTQTCLLAGFNKEVSSGGGHKGGPDSGSPPVVSPTQ